MTITIESLQEEIRLTAAAIATGELDCLEGAEKIANLAETLKLETLRSTLEIRVIQFEGLK